MIEITSVFNIFPESFTLEERIIIFVWISWNNYLTYLKALYFYDLQVERN